MVNELVKSTKLWFYGPASDDVIGAKLYMVTNDIILERKLDGTVHGAQVYDLGMPVPDGDNKVWVDLDTLPGMTSNDGVYNLGIAYVDKGGNESSFFVIPDIALDFVAPDAPTDGGVIRS